MDNIIELKNINKIYGTSVQTQVLFDVNLAFKKESFNSIIGQSGSGKSTLLNIVGTLDKPSSGDVVINGINTNDMNKNQLATLRGNTIGFIFQFHYLLPEFTAIENVLMPIKISGKKISKDILARANGLKDFVGLKEVKKNKEERIDLRPDVLGMQLEEGELFLELVKGSPLLIAAYLLETDTETVRRMNVRKTAIVL